MSYTNGLDKPSDYFVTKLYTGNGGTNAQTGVGFAPNWVWIKNRSGADNNALYDTVRGANKVLVSNNNNAEGSQSDGLTAFGTDGFTVGADGAVNTNGNNFVAWNWKAGTSVSGNTTGSGTAKTYTGSVNTDAGFSIIKYVGNGTAGHTVPHHLGVAPKAMIIKSLAASQSWFINFPFGTGDGYLMLDRTNAGDGSNDSVWSSTAPSSSVVTLGETGGVNENDDAYIMYAFVEKQGYSKFSSYVGNGNVDGTFVYTGFKPAFVFVKRTNGTENWTIMDTTRDTINVATQKLHPNTSGATDAGATIDILSNGFKNRTTNAGANGSGDSYIFYAIAENPFVTSTGVPATAR